MLSILIRCLSVVAILFAAHTAVAQTASDQETYLAAMTKLESELQSRSGDIYLPEAKATLQLGTGYRFYDAQASKRILVEAWGNPPATANGVLGMVFPANASFMDDTWGAVIEYAADGYVSDSDAQDINYTDLMKSMQDGEPALNRERQAAGYDPMYFKGWAQPPTYDAKTHRMIWAKEIQFGAAPVNTLNYDVRILGRHGVLVMNIISEMPKLADVKQQANALMHTAVFSEGARYSDYKAGDTRAAYGLAGMIAGGTLAAAAKKIGLLGIILAFAKKGWILIVMAIAAIFRGAKTLVGKKTANNQILTENQAQEQEQLNKTPSPED